MISKHVSLPRERAAGQVPRIGINGPGTRAIFILVPTLRVGTQALDAPASEEVLTNVVIWTCAVGRRSVPIVRSHAEHGNEDFAVPDKHERSGDSPIFRLQDAPSPENCWPKTWPRHPRIPGSRDTQTDCSRRSSPSNPDIRYAPCDSSCSWIRQPFQ